MNVYLDNAATTPLDPEVFEKMLPYLTGEFGNPDSLHAYGRSAAYAVGEARDRIAQTLGVKPSEVYFTSGGTEADNWAVRMMGAHAFPRSNTAPFCPRHRCAAAPYTQRQIVAEPSP